MQVWTAQQFEEYCAGHNIVQFPKDTYLIEKKNAHMAHYTFSNTDPMSEQAFGCILRNRKKGVIIDGCGSTFVFRGQMTPFAIDSSFNVILRNMTIDFDPPLVAEGVVISACEQYADVRIDTAQYPCECRDEWLYFDIGEEALSPMCHRAQIHFEADKTVTPQSGDDFVPQRVLALGNEVFRIYPENPVRLREGEILVLRHNARLHPGIFIENSYDTRLENITIHSCGGLGILAQFCDHLTLEHVHFLPKPGRLVANGRDDGLHAAACRGLIRIEDCSFFGLMDDPINIHGHSLKLDFVSDMGRVLHARYMHEQAKGFSYYARHDDEIKIYRRDTMECVAMGVVEEFKRDGEDTLRIFLKEAISLPPGDYALENISAAPNVVCKRNRFGSCRARGLLVTTPWEVIVEENYFESSGSAILISGDANYWYESGACGDVRICRNVFSDRCMSSKYEFCDGVISIAPVIPCPGVPFHRNIWVFENAFDTPGTPIVSAFATEGLRILDNRIFISPSRKNLCASNALYRLSHCVDVIIEKNRVIGEWGAPLLERTQCTEVRMNCREWE